MDLSNVKAFIEANDNFAIIGHANPDGDCIGSCLGLWHILCALGKKAAVKIGFEDYPNNLKFLWTPESVSESTAFDAYIALDCAGEDRLSCCSDRFSACPNTLCIDHHRTNKGFASVNAVFPEAAAAGEIIYNLAAELLGDKLDIKTAECIYTAIVSDTGGFKYSSTTGNTMRAGASLLDMGIDSVGIYKKLFDTYTQKQIEIISDVAGTLTTHFGGRVCVISITDELLAGKGMRPDDADFLVSLPRAIEGSEVGVFLKKRGDCVKVSLRSGENVDVSEIAASLGGGGHMRAAGITIEGNLEQVKGIILNKLSELFDDKQVR